MPRVSGTNGGIWRSEDTGKTWTLMLAGNATDVILDADSAVPLNTGREPRRNGQSSGCVRRHARAGGLHEPQSGTGLEPDGGQRRQSVDYRYAHGA